MELVSLPYNQFISSTIERLLIFSQATQHPFPAKHKNLLQLFFFLREGPSSQERVQFWPFGSLTRMGIQFSPQVISKMKEIRSSPGLLQMKTAWERLRLNPLILE